jgi:hypothetical protein
VLVVPLELSDEEVLPLIEPALEFFCESIEPLCEWLAGICMSGVDVVPDDAAPD